MSGVTISCRLEPRQHRSVLPKEKVKSSSRQHRRSDRTARMLALAHHLEALVEDGRLPDYSSAARILGLTRARITQVMNLLHLAPDLQESLLLGALSIPERHLRVVVGSVDWAPQRRIVAADICAVSQ